ncbi:unnamed protein product [Amoebophrya sp. A120]|nr:unnamed protein product [Amoebophrya sp. A120]|eukprot:GSA120T00025367001.1
MHSNRLDLFKKLVQNVGWDKDTANIFPPGTTVAASGQLNEGLRLLVYKELEKMKEDIDKTHAEYAVAKNDKGDVLRVVNALDFVDKKSVVLESFAMWQAQCLVQLFKQDEVAKKAGGDQATKFMNDVAQLEQVVQEMTRNFEKPQEKMQQLQLLRDEVTAGIQTFLCNDPKMVTTIAERRPLLHHSPHVIVANLVTPHSGDVMSGKKTTEFRKTLGELAKDFPSEGDPSVPDLTLLQRLPLLFRGNKSVIAVAAIKQVKILKTASECEEAARSGYSDPDYGSKTVLQYLGAKDYQSAMKKPIYAIEFENTVVLRKPVPMERTGNAFQNVLCVKHRPGWAEAAIEEATRVAWSDGKDAEEDAKLSEEDASDGDEDQDARLSDGNEHEHESDEEEFWDDGVVPMEIC